MARRTVAPCTCQPNWKRSQPHPVAAATRARFSSTLARSSAVLMPRLSESKGPPDTPPRRVVNSARAPGTSAAMWSPSQRNGRASSGSIARSMLRPSAAASCSSRLSARPSSIASIAASSAAPTAGPCSPAATMSWPSIARRRWRTSLEPAPRGRLGPARARRRRPPPAAPGADAATARRRRMPSLDLAGSRPPRARCRARRPGTRGRRAAASASGAASVQQRGEVGAPVRRRQRDARGATVSGSTANSGPSSARAEPVALERQQRRRLRLAQQQAQLGAQPRARHRVHRAAGHRLGGQPIGARLGVERRAGRRSGRAAAGASGRRGTSRRGARAARRAVEVLARAAAARSARRRPGAGRSR